MAVLKFRIYLEEDDAVYRDVCIKHTQSFADFEDGILKSFEFDKKHESTFYRSNDSWQRGREISRQRYNKAYRAEPLIMSDTTVGSEIRDTNQKFVFHYDFTKNWIFLVELINVSKEAGNKMVYPAVVRVEGIGPQQYGTKSLLGNKFVDIEEKYDLQNNTEGFGEEGEESGLSSDEAESDSAESESVGGEEEDF